jgi:hypothetical protein
METGHNIPRGDNNYFYITRRTSAPKRCCVCYAHRATPTRFLYPGSSILYLRHHQPINIPSAKHWSSFLGTHGEGTGQKKPRGDNDCFYYTRSTWAPKSLVLVTRTVQLLHVLYTLVVLYCIYIIISVLLGLPSLEHMEKDRDRKTKLRHWLLLQYQVQMSPEEVLYLFHAQWTSNTLLIPWYFFIVSTSSSAY